MATAPQQMVEFCVEINARGMTEISVRGKHVSVEDLREHISKDSTIWTKIRQLGRPGTDKLRSEYNGEKPKILDYLKKDMPAYPTPVEFHVSQVSHVTKAEPYRQILDSEGFKPPASNLSWWSLNIKEEEIKSAEKRYLQKIFPDQSQEHITFLDKFTNSPAFQSESRYGNYRFTFPLKELMEMYQEQHCGGEEPVLRVMKTMFYKQEILYGVLIHGPQHNERFRRYPLLENNSELVQYEDGEMIWRAQAISDDLKFRLLVNTDEASVEVQSVRGKKYWYVWDHVCLAFYLPGPDNALKVPREKLIEAAEACKLHEINLVQKRYKTDEEREREREEWFETAKKVVEDLRQELEDEPEHVNALRN